METGVILNKVMESSFAKEMILEQRLEGGRECVCDILGRRSVH